MNISKLACCYFPSTALFIDDRKEYLQSLRLILDQDLCYENYYDPEAAIHFLTKNSPTPFIRKWASTLDLATVHQEIYCPNRFKEISLIVVDYAMPRMNGLELCEQLKESPIKKLLVTGVAGNALGVKALNDNLIDAFILKSDEDFYDQLHDKIHELQAAYFQDLSAGIIENLTITANTCLNDPFFIKFFQDLCNQHQIAEYYLVNDSGGFLLLNAEGDVSWLLIKSEHEMKRHYSIAHENNGPQDIINALENRTQLLFRFTHQDVHAESIEEWRKHLYPAQMLPTKHGNFYYSYIEGVSSYDIQADKIFSYQNYLDKRK